MLESTAQQVILISIDNLRADCVSYNPDKSLLVNYSLDHYPVTPTLDHLATTGIVFSRCFSAAPYTTASHASILTGAFPARHGIREYYRHAISTEVPTLFELFKEAGYTTILATDFPFLLGHHLGFTRSVDHYIVEKDTLVLQFLQELRAERVFAFVHFGSVHSPFGLTNIEVDGDYFVEEVERVATKMNVPEQFALDREWIERPRPTRERLLRQRYHKALRLMYEQGLYNELMQLYINGVEYFDGHRLRNFIHQLEREVFSDDSVLAIIADHGEEYDQRSEGHYNGLWEGIINVPLILRGPRLPMGHVYDAVCRSVDLAPTLMELTGNGVSPRAAFDGVSLLPLIRGDQPTDVCQIARGETWFGNTAQILEFMALCQSADRLLQGRQMATTYIAYLRDSEWKLVLRCNLPMGIWEYMLFDMKGDRLERHNVADQQPELVECMTRNLTADQEAWSGQQLILEAHQLDELVTNLRDIGYLND